MFEDKNEIMSQLGSICRESGYEINSPEDFDLNKLFTYTVNLLNCLDPTEQPAQDVFRDYFKIALNESKVRHLLNKEKYFDVFKAALSRSKKYKLLSKNDSLGVAYVSNVYGLDKYEMFFHGAGFEEDGSTCHKFVYEHHKLFAEKGVEVYLDTKKMIIRGIRGDNLCEVVYDSEEGPCFEEDNSDFTVFRTEGSGLLQVYKKEYINSLNDNEEPDPNKIAAIFYTEIPDESTNLGFCCMAFGENLSGDDIAYLITLGAATILSFDKAMRDLR
ncbi:MAG: hypothetical protein MJ213_04510 [Bacilli bacterium]|nr:hypothetical protein [Bacilli bacterium]